MMIKKTLALLTGLIVLFGIAACGGTGATPGSSSSGKISVVVSFDAIKEFALAVGGDKVEVTAMIPDGTEPHDFEPKAKDMAELSGARVFIYNGFGMEDWVDEAVKAANNKDLIVVEASKGAEPITNDDPEVVSEHGQYDPHLWLSLKGAELEAQNIRDALIQADPSSSEEFTKNCDAFARELESLYNEYAEKFQAVENKDFVTGHAAFAYLCRDFGLRQNSVEDVFAEGEPTAQNLADLVEYCKTYQVKTIFAEEMASSAVSETLADEVGAEVKTIYTIESSEDGKTYLQRMTDSLIEIYNSLK